MIDNNTTPPTPPAHSLIHKNGRLMINTAHLRTPYIIGHRWFKHNRKQHHPKPLACITWMNERTSPSLLFYISRSKQRSWRHVSLLSSAEYSAIWTCRWQAHLITADVRRDTNTVWQIPPYWILHYGITCDKLYRMSSRGGIIRRITHTPWRHSRCVTRVSMKRSSSIDLSQDVV